MKKVFPKLVFINDNSASVAFARTSPMSLMRSLVEAYLEVSMPSLARPHVLRFFASWKFDWRGNTPKEYTGREDEYHGMRMQKTFEDFSQHASDPGQAPGTLFVLWSMLSHFPYIFHPDGSIHDSSAVAFEPGMSDTRIVAVEENYIRALRNADRLLGRFLKHLQENNLYDSATIVITSDHGMSDTGNNARVDSQVALVPFFLKTHGVSPGPNDRDVQTVDITPTLLDIVGLLPEDSFYDGQSLIRPYRQREKVMFGLGATGYWILEGSGLWAYRK